MTRPTRAQIEAAAIAFTKAIFDEYWPECHDIDGATVHELGEKFGVIVKVKYDPEVHGEAEYDQEPGDDWFVLNPALTTTAAQVGDEGRGTEIEHLRQALYEIDQFSDTHERARQIARQALTAAKGRPAMTVTQAQIEAAAKAICDYRHYPDTEAWINLGELQDDYRTMAKAALTAAQGGEQDLDDEIIKALDDAETLENHTIERCAQVADAEIEECKEHCVGEILMGQVGAASRIAAAIRKLKDDHAPAT